VLPGGPGSERFKLRAVARVVDHREELGEILERPLQDVVESSVRRVSAHAVRVLVKRREQSCRRAASVEKFKNWRLTAFLIL
jgi:hypothetical protein